MALLFGILPMLTPISVTTASSITLAWDAPTNVTNIAGYDLYYGTTSGNYPCSLSVSNVTTATLTNLAEGVVYYFAAKTRSTLGMRSGFSAETAFTNAALVLQRVLQPETQLLFVVPPPDSAGGRFTFSLEPGAPAGATLNPTDGTFSWKPSIDQSSTTNWITVRITDLEQPTHTTFVSLAVVVQDRIACNLGSASVQAGQNISVPITVNSSEGVTHLAFTIDWPANRFMNPAVSEVLPGIALSLVQQPTSLVITLQAASGQVPKGISQLGFLNFQTEPNQSSGFVPLPVSLLSATKPTAETYANLLAQGGEIAVVGDQPFLKASSPTSAPADAQPLQVNAPEHSLTVLGQVGTSYQLQSATRLGPEADWTPLLTYTQNAVVQTLSVPATNLPVFYRLVR